MQHFCAAGKFREREKSGALDGIRRTLRAGIERANGFDRVAEKLDADGLRSFGREDVNDAAAHGELAGHFAGDLFVVAGAGEEVEKFAVRDFLIALDAAGELAIKFGFAHAPQGRLDGRDHQVGIAVGESPERDGAVFGNFGVRRAIVVGQDFEAGKMHDAMAGLAGDGAVKPAKRLDERFGTLIRFDEEDGGATEFGGCEGRDESFRGIGEAVEAHFAPAAAQRLDCFFYDGLATDPREKLRYQGQNHALRFLMRSIRRAVEWPGSRGMRTTLLPARAAASSASKAA